MCMIKSIETLSAKKFIAIAAKCTTKVELYAALNIHDNGTFHRLISNKLEATGAKLKEKKLKYKRITKSCPVCDDPFSTLEGHPREKITCSYGCSNTYFRSGKNNPNWKDSTYRSTCFLYHKKRCIICDENLVVEAHHYDGDKDNNDPSNLIPLCPTHHKYAHNKKHIYIIRECIEDYITSWLRRI